MVSNGVSLGSAGLMEQFGAVPKASAGAPLVALPDPIRSPEFPDPDFYSRA